MKRPILSVVLLAVCIPLAACDESLFGPPVPARYERFLVLGGSVAAGTQSWGLTAESQSQAYPSLLATYLQANLAIRRVAAPGCPAPIQTALTAPGEPLPCTVSALVPGNLRSQVVAVPGTRVADAAELPAEDRVPLHRPLLGTRTQLEALTQSRATFAIVHLGDHDVWEAAILGSLGPPTAGADSLLTRLSTFLNAYDRVVETLVDLPDLEHAVLIGVTDPIDNLPILQRGTYFYAARDVNNRIYGKLVNQNCSPFTALGQPNSLSLNLVSHSIFLDDAFTEVNCDPNAYPAGDARRGRYLLDTQEQAIVRARVIAFNDAIRQRAQANGWTYVDPNEVYAAALERTDAQGRFPLIRNCQLLATAVSAGQIQTAVLNSCPVTGPTAASSLFGSAISLDGVHPAGFLHFQLAALVAEAL